VRSLALRGRGRSQGVAWRLENQATKLTSKQFRAACLISSKVICELITDGEVAQGKPAFEGGGMMRRDNCLAFEKEWGIKVCTIEDLVKHIVDNEDTGTHIWGHNFAFLDGVVLVIKD
jgi:3,4-dihydroxy-2-butanone 4-phosphate synthase